MTAKDLGTILERLRDAYMELVNGRLTDAEEFAREFLAPQIRHLERMQLHQQRIEMLKIKGASVAFKHLSALGASEREPIPPRQPSTKTPRKKRG